MTDSVSGEQIDTGPGKVPSDIDEISCNNNWSINGVENPYTSPDGTFASGTWECNFTMENYRIKTQSITADDNKTVLVPMSKVGGLTEEEHDWLEAIYKCEIQGIGCYA